MLENLIDPWQVLLFLFVAGGVLGATYPRWWPKVARKWNGPPVETLEYNMKLQAAIEHVLDQNPSSYVSRLNAEMNVFRGIYKLALSGEVHLWGPSSEGSPPAPIPLDTLKELMPVDVVVPRSKEAPEGHVYGLASKPSNDPLRNYRNLLVAPMEIYKHWPQTNKDGVC